MSDSSDTKGRESEGEPESPEVTPQAIDSNSSSRKLKGAAALLALVGSVTVWAAISSPPIDAKFETARLAGGSVVGLREVTLEGPLETSIGSFGYSQIPPAGSQEAGGRGKKLLILLRVSKRSCGNLEAKIGGSCHGRPKPPSHPTERFTIRSEGRAMEALLSLTPATVVQLGQNADPTQPGPPPEWSLREGAPRATLRLRCRTKTPLGVTLLPGQAHPICAPDAAVFKLLITNHLPYLPILTFNRANTMVAAAKARQASITAEHATLTLAGSAEEISGLEPTEATLEAVDKSQVSLRLRAPDGLGNTAVELATPEAASVTLDGENEIPSRLNRNTTVRTLLFGLLATLALTVVLELFVIHGSRRKPG